MAAPSSEIRENETKKKTVVEPIRISIPHMDETDQLVGFTSLGYMFAGATAGVTEHIVMYPVDTIKTNMQARHVHSNFVGVVETALKISKEEGILRLYRGLSAVAAGAIPSHALYFLAYEGCRHKLGGVGWGGNPLADAASGAIATAIHDATACPVDVVKQRMQLHQSTSHRIFQTFKQVYSERGLRTFFAGYPTTLVMNVPFFSVYFMAYEQFRKTFSPKDGSYSPISHCIAGGLAGAMGAGISTPLDVIKTRLQTQVGASHETKRGFMATSKDIMLEFGTKGFFHGMTARMLYHMPAAAICWVTYEYVSHMLGISRVKDYFLDTSSQEDAH